MMPDNLGLTLLLPPMVAFAAYLIGFISGARQYHDAYLDGSIHGTEPGLDPHPEFRNELAHNSKNQAGDCLVITPMRVAEGAVRTARYTPPRLRCQREL